ncbi:MAG: carboxypeptidase regulatory-like domain-containing protein [Acidobacteriota bacterium]
MDHLRRFRREVDRAEDAGSNGVLRKYLAVLQLAESGLAHVAGPNADLPPLPGDAPSDGHLQPGDTCAGARALPDGTWDLAPRSAEGPLWLRATAGQDGWIRLHTRGSRGDTALAVYRTCAAEGSAETLAADDDGAGLRSAVSWRASEGDTFWIRLESSNRDGLRIHRGAGTGAIAGTVSTAAEGPLASVLVEVYTLGGAYRGSFYTGQDGTWIVGGLDAVDHVVRTYYAGNLGYVDQLWEGHHCFPGVCGSLTGNAIAVVDGATTGGIDFVLVEGAAVEGRLRAASGGQALDGVYMQARDLEANFLGAGYTDVAGRYRISRLPTGPTLVETRSALHLDEVWDDVPCPGGCDYGAATPIEVTIDETVGGIDFELRAFGTIEGTVTDAQTGSPLSFASVRIRTADGTSNHYVSANFAGHYRAAVDRPGEYYVTASDFGYAGELWPEIQCHPTSSCDLTSGTAVTVGYDGATEGIDFTLDPLGGVRGEVTSAADGLLVGYGRVTAYDAEGLYFDDAYLYSRAYELSLPPGTFFLKADGSGHVPEMWDDAPCPDLCDPTTGDPLTIVAGATTEDIDFVLSELANLAGTVTAEGGMPLPGIRVHAYPAGDGFSRSAITDDDGRYEIGGLDADSYYVYTSTSEPYLDELYDDIPCEPSCSVTGGDPVPVATGEAVTGIDFTLDALGTISGTVVAAASRSPVAGIRVEARGPFGEFLAWTATDEQGRYRLPVPTGEAFVLTRGGAVLRDELYDDVPCHSGCDYDLGTALSVALNADVAGIDFALEPLGGISGSVTSAATGEALVGVLVHLYTSQGAPRGNTQSGADGTFVLPHLDAGTYFLAAASHEGHLGQLWQGLPCPSTPFGGCTPTTGTPVAVTLGEDTPGIDFELPLGGVLAGTVLDDAGGVPVPDGRVHLFDAFGSSRGFAYLGPDGSFELTGIPAGTYYALTRDTGYYDELYDGAPCHGFPYCDPLGGTPIAVAEGATTQIAFGLARLGVIEGRVVLEGGRPAEQGQVQLRDAQGLTLARFYLGAGGTFRFDGRGPGQYYVLTSGIVDHIDEAYGGLPCETGCDIQTSTPVPLALAQTISGIDFDLAFGPGLCGRVTDAATGYPLPGAGVDLWTQGGQHLRAAASGPDGHYCLGWGSGDVLVSTDNGLWHTDELWNDVPCPLGPAFGGLCDVLLGDPVTVVPNAAATRNVDFTLTPVGLLFFDGFESGGVTAWSSAAGAVP